METNSLLNKVTWLPEASLVTLIIILGISSALFTSCEPSHSEERIVVDYSQKDLVARGKYLVNTSACHDCHTPKIMTPNGPEFDTTRLLSGHPASDPKPKVNQDALENWILFGQDLTSAAGPWGVSFAANLTSDDTGIGNWTEEQFFRAIRKGKYKGLEGSRDLLPPMPWQVYRGMTDADLKAIYAYLQSTKPIANIVPGPIAPHDIQ